MFSFLLIILLNTLIVSGKNYSSLTETLMVDYNHNIIPLLNNDYVNLTMGMALRSLNKIDQMDGTLSANLWLRYWWEDEYLKWRRVVNHLPDNAEFYSFGESADLTLGLIQSQIDNHLTFLLHKAKSRY